MVKKIFLIFYFVSALIAAQEKSDRREEFNRAVNYYNSARYDQALKIFSVLADDNTFSLSIPSKIFQGKILTLQDRFDEAEKVLTELKSDVKNDEYQEEIILNSAVLYFNRGMYYESAEELLDLIPLAEKGEYYDYAGNLLDTIAVYYLDPIQVNILYDIKRPEVKPLLMLLYGKSLLAEGRRQEAREVFLKLTRQYPSASVRKEAEDYYYERKTVLVQEETEPVIALLFPRDPDKPNRAVDEIIEGIKYAVHTFNSGREEKIGIVFIDLEKENIKEIKNTILNLNSKCVIGPVFSDDVRLVLNSFRGVNIPLISPTATDNDLTRLNDFFFQANPNFVYRARAMAQYLYYVENKRRMGVLNSIDGYSPLLAADFIQEFRNLGGEVVINQTYKSKTGITDESFTRFIEKIPEVEGLYVPISDREDIAQLITSLSMHNLSPPLYGNQDWFISRGYESYPGLNNIVFTSDYFIDYNSKDYMDFNQEFRKTTGMDAERNVLYGFDITKYFLNQLTKINAGADLIAQRMMNGNTVTGYHNNVCFDEARVNKYLNIIRYNNGVFELVDKFKTSR
jgi:ABC-type branched-subunit amino acid transport system substrate-binding protein